MEKQVVQDAADEINKPAAEVPPPIEDELAQTISVRPPALKKESTGLEVAKRTALLAAISATVAALVKKTLYPFAVKYGPKNFPINVPDEVGFFSGGIGGGAMFLFLQRKVSSQKMSRRDFFPVIGAGMGAVIGGMMTKQPTLHETPQDPTNSPASLPAPTEPAPSKITQ